MEQFLGYIEFWLAAVIVYTAYKIADMIIGEVYETLRAKYIVWSWKRRK